MRASEIADAPVRLHVGSKRSHLRETPYTERLSVRGVMAPGVLD